ncbi:Cytochrome P450 [Legionella quinlivanii]|uniref:Cytochrome P450 n=1 Tax=Legionella quinlivanii TaxID=45073 RepID=A0A0W0XUR9_9GAMM|nr:cytochrome P450 [Legionella quinlivanii]KTD47923.1 Cytochrome P450 [Legionella quinlivanii]SEG36672.1 Cytochrome P450 [Legionella quinlivanii DSM 21216]STY10083.1 Cytochrome P450 [Legionella quinlivanii]
MAKEVRIEKRRDNRNILSRTIGKVIQKAKDYSSALTNTIALVFKYNAGKDLNAFHHLLEDRFRELPIDQTKILDVPVISPSIFPPRLVQRVVAIGNPYVLLEIEKLPCAQSFKKWYEDNPEKPPIKRGRAFSSILEAIGMGILTEDQKIHDDFLDQMHSLQFSGVKDPKHPNHQFQTNFLEVIKKETDDLIETIKARSGNNEAIELDFLVFSLKIFLKSFYPKSDWSDENWINQLARQIENVSHEAFKNIMDPYGNIQSLRALAAKHLDPFIDKILEDEEPAYLSADYVKRTSRDIKKQIIIALLFAGGDNIRRLIEHGLVKFGQDEIYQKYFSKGVTPSDLQTYVKELERLITIIYAQPGEAEEDFVIEFEGEEFFVKEGDQLHYTTWIATTDEKEWGEHAREYNPEANKDKHKELKADLTFGANRRRCRGNIVTHEIIHELFMRILNEFEIESFVNGQKGIHPMKKDFNNEVDGPVTVRYTPKAAQKPGVEKGCVNSEEQRNPENTSKVKDCYRGLAEKGFISQLNKTELPEVVQAMDVAFEPETEGFLTMT